MHLRSNRGFILPYSLFTAAVILALSTLVLIEEFNAAERSRQAGARRRLSTLAKHNLATLVEKLETTMLLKDSVSAVLETHPGSGVFQMMSLRPEKEDSQGLHSALHSDPARNVLFSSHGSKMKLKAGLISLSPEGEVPRTELAWTAEDLCLAPGPGEPGEGWLLPSPFYAPVEDKLSPEQFLAPLMEKQYRSGPWISAEVPLPFSPEVAPDLVPVVTRLGLRFGIFASAISGGREKVIRIRFYLEGGLWNPYNRILSLHPGTARSPSFQIVFWNLPEVRIINESRGTATGWIELDAIANPVNGAIGIHGWVETPGQFEAGQSLDFLAPNQEWQPEGLARVLHPGFLVGPADWINIEVKPSLEGVSAACLTKETSNPLQAARNGEGWFRIEDVPIAFETLEFRRADESPRSFYLSGGSLSFRLENCHAQIILNRPRDTLQGLVDPRQKTMGPNKAWRDVAGNLLTGRDLIDFTARNLRREDPFAEGQMGKLNIFSWPEKTPDNLISAMDLSAWPGGFLLGTAGADNLNNLLNSSAAWQARGSPAPSIPIDLAPGKAVEFTSTLPVNSLSVSAWETAIRQSTNGITERGDLVFARFPSPFESKDYAIYTDMEIQSAAKEITRQLLKEPARSVPDFFNRGILANAFRQALTEDPLLELFPLRCWLRKGPPPRSHGSLWILHLAIRGTNGEATVHKTARLWLLEVPGVETANRFAPVRFEWTEPEVHCPEILIKS